ncbi:MAG TPA: cobalamin-binding protein [Terriglobales bacterium]|jgi:iron complex transport system substrate-binding protein|nr:cobalamin-binding protein [Terriglobales bacterium]
MRRHLSAILLLLVLTGCCLAQRTVQDELGRKVVVANSPHRIVSLAPSITDTIYAIGAGADIVGVSNYTKYPPEATKKPSVGEPLNPSIETIIALHPDLVLAIEDMNRLETVEQLEKAGIPVFVVHPHDLAGIYASITDLGTALNRPKEAAGLVSRLHGREQAVRDHVKGAPAPQVFFVLWPDPVMTVGKHAFITELIEIAGAKSVTDDMSDNWPQISAEALLVRKPDFLLLVRGSQLTIDDLKKKPGWNSLEAVRANHVFYTDDRVLHPSPAAFDALEDLANQFHPLGQHR